MCASTRITAADAARSDDAPPLQVAVGAIVREDGRYLLSRRRADAHQGGRWEFPGGKIEAGETPETALDRELYEELGIRPLIIRPLISIAHRYPERHVRLHVYRVESFSGTPEPREGQAFDWFDETALCALSLPDANRGIVAALRLPDRYLITPEPDVDEARFFAGIEAALRRGVRLVQLRAKSVDEHRLRLLASGAVDVCRRHGARLMLNGRPELARVVGADGVHLSASQLQTVQGRPDLENLYIAASCHNERELVLAGRLGVDFAVCSPVRPTASHPGAPAIGWLGFEAMCAQAPFPVYALGGLDTTDIEEARRRGGQGVAAIRGLWEGGQAYARHA